MKTKEELDKEIEDYKKEIESLKEELDIKNGELAEYYDRLDSAGEEETRLNELLWEWEEKQTLDSSNLMEQQKAELLVKAQKRFTLQELEERLGGNSFTL